VTHVDDELLAPLIARFGRPAEWDGSREITERDSRMILRSNERERTHDVTFVITEGDEVVVIRKPFFPPGAWRAPSGGVARGESFEEGTLREALEETGLAIELTGYPLVCRSVFTHGGANLPWTSHVVTATSRSRALAPRDTEEIAACRWMAVDELLGPVARVLRSQGGELFSYRADLHERVFEQIRGGGRLGGR
jgi:ADP-ribose pyrophosphatase YjhB (NUDIX family)